MSFTYFIAQMELKLLYQTKKIKCAVNIYDLFVKSSEVFK